MENDLDRILRACERIPEWWGEVARFIFAAYAYTGLRMSELRRAEFRDVNTREWLFFVRHPKGESSYGRQRTIPIPPPLKPYVLSFLQERAKMLVERGLVEAKCFVCKKSGNPNEPYSTNGFETLKLRVEKESGITFQIRTLRRTYGQVLLNREVPLDSVSLTMGHRYTSTTEKYYCRKDDGMARLEVLRGFEMPSPAPSFNTPQIEKENDYTGYA